uniref:Mce/MlaD domain-containing protein n=1 Tax=Cannabis sativa TaxID=3483 RepID=A0A803Q324_CANSA
MVGNPMAQASTCPTVLFSSLGSVSYRSSNHLPYLPFRSKRKMTQISATSSETGHDQAPSSEKKNPLAAVLNVPQAIWKRTLRPLSDFGFGHRSIWEGGVGLFLVSGAVILALSIAWLRGFQMRYRFRKYMAVFEFSQACGISNGTPVRIRGVTVGNVVGVNPSLRSIEAVVEVKDDKIIIPRNSLIEVNQSGLLMETIIDITPRDPIPNALVGPLDPDCAKEGLIVCDKEKVKGQQGVSLDALVGIFTRLGRDVEEIVMFQIQAMAEDIQPLLAEVRDSGLLKEVESLTKSLTEASNDLR